MHGLTPFPTSVCQVSALLNEAYDPTPNVDLNINDHIVVRFRAGTSQSYIIEADDPTLIGINETNGRQDVTALRITGSAAPGGVRKMAHIYIYGLATPTPRTPANAVATLEVLVLPLFRPTLAIWKVEDKTPGAATDIPAQIDLPQIWNAFLYTRRAFRQACIILAPVPSTPGLSANVNAPYDKDLFVGEPLPQAADFLKNNEFDMSRIDRRPASNNQWLEHANLQTSVKMHYATGAEANLAIVKILNDGTGFANKYGKGGLTSRNGASIAVINSSNMFGLNGGMPFTQLYFNRVCAHEVGHQFEMSIRGASTITDGHDHGPFERDSGNKLWVGLMHGSDAVGVDTKTEWMWHDDWWSANGAASQKQKNWTPHLSP